MVILSIVAPSKTGKTTFLEHLIPLLCAEQIRVGALKHCHHSLSERENTDSMRLQKSGASPSIATCSSNFNMFLPLFSGCDLLLVEGFRKANLPSIVLERENSDPLWIPPQHIIARVNIVLLSKAIENAYKIIKALLFTEEKNTII